MDTIKFMRFGLAVGCLLMLGSALADEGHGLGHWQGTGQTFQVRGPAEGTFTVDVRRTRLSEGVVELQGKVTLADGTRIPISQREISQGPDSFRIESEQGAGVGRCYGEGLCQTYLRRKDGSAMATTLVIDDHDHLRLLITQLKNGQAVRIIRERLTRVEQG